MQRPASLLAALGLAAAALAAVPAQGALVGHWTFDEQGGSTAADSSGSGFAGTLQGAAAWSGNGRFGGALDLSAGGFVNMGDVLNLTGSLTVSAWVNTTSTAGMVPVSNHRATVVAGYLLAVGNINDGIGGAPGQFHFYKAYPTSPLSSTVVNDGEWHMITGVYDQSTGAIRTYVDGQFQGFNAGAAATTFSVSDFVVGGVTLSNGVNAGAYTGLIDDVRVYDGALGAAEVAALMTPVPEPGHAWLMGAGLLGVLAAVRRRRRPS